MNASSIHPTAIVAPDAIIGDGCRIGPYCVIGSGVHLGVGTCLLSHVVLDGGIRIGDDCEIHPFACLGGKTQDLKYAGGGTRVRIGARCVIREYVTVNASTGPETETVIGNDCQLQSYCHVAHECVLGNHVVMSSGTMIAGHVEVGERAWLAGCVGVVPFVRIGDMAYVGGYSKVTQDILPYCLAEGAPAGTRAVNHVGMQRNGRCPATVRAAKRAYLALLRSGLTVEQAAQELEDLTGEYPEVAAMVAFAAASTRGLARPRTP